MTIDPKKLHAFTVIQGGGQKPAARPLGSDAARKAEQIRKEDEAMRHPNPKPSQVSSKIWIIQYPDGKYAGSPATTIAPNRNMSGTYKTEAEAQRVAHGLGKGAKAVPYN